MAPVLSTNEFRKRRQRLMKAIGKDAVAVIPTHREMVRNRDSHYPFRADSDFHYLTGFNEPDAMAVIAPGRKEGQFLLFCRPRDPLMETWNGRRAGLEGAMADYGADQAFDYHELDGHLPTLLGDRSTVYYTLGRQPELDIRFNAWLEEVRQLGRSGVRAPTTVTSLDEILHEMRLIKSPQELKLMAHAARVSAETHIRAMQHTRPGKFEYEVEAELLHGFRRHGCEMAYGNIVAGGENACILHYTENNARLADGELLLIDAGAEYRCYAADITRTFPVNGRFSPEQRAIYELVLKAQLAAIRQVKPGKHWNQPHEAAVKVLTQGLVELGILKGEAKQLIKDGAYREFYMHRTGHWLGMDVHDVGTYKQDDKWRRFEPGMVLTVEPGLYIAPGSKGVAKKWHGIGVRIEDDVAVTAAGCEVLTAGVPKLADEIEALMAAS